MSHEIELVLEQVSQVILGKRDKIKLALSCLISGGHLLIEDLPGMGKTTLAQSLALSMGMHYKRVQFTSDLLPADILGVSIFDQKSGEFTFKKGPVFSQLLLADEINRATPKTQSALLESMEEGRVSMDGESYELPKPFIVIATQNPSHQMGTYPLPESQLDRFLMRISLGYPSDETERALISGTNPRDKIPALKGLCKPDDILALGVQVNQVHMTQAMINYIHRLVLRTRESAELSYGLSPRGSIALTKAAKAWALLSKRDHLLPEDVQAVFESVVEHRIKGIHQQKTGALNTQLSRAILESVDVIA